MSDFTQIEIRRVQTSVDPAPKDYEFHLTEAGYDNADSQLSRPVNISQTWRKPVWVALAQAAGGGAAYFALLQAIYLVTFGSPLVDMRRV